MILRLIALLYLTQLVHGSSTNSTTPQSCPPLDGTSRSVWSILGSCALTLLICIWHTIHFNVPRNKQQATLGFKCLWILAAFLAPEAIIGYAAREWYTARTKVRDFRAKGYEWSMTHSFFAGMGGFVYLDEGGRLDSIDCDRFLQLCERNEIMNPCVTVEDIRDRSKSDWIGKAILAIQLVWFMVQVVVRGSVGLAVTLVELDTVCMAVLSVIAIGLWWYKPLRPTRPHVFYSRRVLERDAFRLDTSKPPPEPTPANEEMKKDWSDTWKPEPMLPHALIARWRYMRGKKEIGAQFPYDSSCTLLEVFIEFLETMAKFTIPGRVILSVTYFSLAGTWFVLGGLHLIAWNFDFPTRDERIAWRIASFVLAGSSVYPFTLGLLALLEFRYRPRPVLFLASVLGVTSRIILVGLMLASLRALPCSAHYTVSWTSYIPHL